MGSRGFCSGGRVLYDIYILNASISFKSRSESESESIYMQQRLLVFKATVASFWCHSVSSSTLIGRLSIIRRKRQLPWKPEVSAAGSKRAMSRSAEPLLAEDQTACSAPNTYACRGHDQQWGPGTGARLDKYHSSRGCIYGTSAPVCSSRKEPLKGTCRHKNAVKSDNIMV